MYSDSGSLDQHKSGYLIKVALMYFFCVLDLTGNTQGDQSTGSNAIEPFVWIGAQLVAQLLNWLLTFLLMFGTYLFQVGLLGILAKEFRAALWVLPAYFVVFAIHAVHKIVLMSKGIVGVDLWQNGLFTALSMLSKLVALAYYIVVIRVTIKMGQPKLYQKAPWVTQYQAQALVHD